jgi:hypothetical protein
MDTIKYTVVKAPGSELLSVLPLVRALDNPLTN